MDCLDEETEFNEQTWLYYVDEKTKHLKFDIDAWLKTNDHFVDPHFSQVYENNPCSRVFSRYLNISLDVLETNKTLLEDITIGHDSLEYLELDGVDVKKPMYEDSNPEDLGDDTKIDETSIPDVKSLNLSGSKTFTRHINLRNKSKTRLNDEQENNEASSLNNEILQRLCKNNDILKVESNILLHSQDNNRISDFDFIKIDPFNRTFHVEDNNELYENKGKEELSDNSIMQSKLKSAEIEPKQEVRSHAQKTKTILNSVIANSNKEASIRVKEVAKSIPVLKKTGSRLPMPIHRKPISKSMSSLVRSDSKK